MAVDLVQIQKLAETKEEEISGSVSSWNPPTQAARTGGAAVQLLALS
jgi:hypothetical protein